MIVQREYNLPNCILIVSGMSDPGRTYVSEEGIKTEVIDSILSAECKFVGKDKSLSGEKDFFDNLIATVSSYAQEFLSGLRYPKSFDKDKPNSIAIERVDNKNLHRLSWQPADLEKVEIELTTLQLFDLVEAIDQFFADRFILPDRQLELKPLSKRHVISDEPITKRSAPAALGLTGLALSGLVLFLTPIPEKERSPRENLQPTSTEQPQEEERTPSN
ncbi:MAG: DUF4335 domain-containing protein [Prochloraceae cyanobacterium]